MTHRPPQHSSEGFAAFEGISHGTLSAAEHDMSQGSDTARQLISGLAESSPALALYVLGQARQAREDGIDIETAFIRGALTILGPTVKSERARILAQQLSGDPVVPVQRISAENYVPVIAS